VRGDLAGPFLPYDATATAPDHLPIFVPFISCLDAELWCLERGVPPYGDGGNAGSPELAQLVSDAQAGEATAAPDTLRMFQSVVGSLLYCAVHTRPDICYATSMLCRVMSKPTPELLHEALRVLAYLYHWRELGLTYERSLAPLAGYSDSDWAERHSTSGFVFKWQQAAVSWASTKQVSVALSSCEAEIVAASEGAKEGVYLRALLQELGVELKEPTDLAVDNRAARDLCYNPEHHRRTKHIARRHFFVREKVEEGVLKVPFVRSADNLADFFTKALPPKTFFSMRDEIMNVGARPPVVARALAAFTSGGCGTAMGHASSLRQA
jgi:hypothetical protein